MSNSTVLATNNNTNNNQHVTQSNQQITLQISPFIDSTLPTISYGCQTTSTINDVTEFISQQLHTSNKCIHVLVHGMVVSSKQSIAHILDNSTTQTHLQYIVLKQDNDVKQHNVTPTIQLPTIIQQQNIQNTMNTPVSILLPPSNNTQSILQYYTQLQQYYPSHYQYLCTQYPYITQQLHELRTQTSNNNISTDSTSTSTNTSNVINASAPPVQPNVQNINVQPDNNNNNNVYNNNINANNNAHNNNNNNQANIGGYLNINNLWRFLHIQLILKISILLFLFCQNGDIYRTTLMCIVAAIAYLYQVGAFGNAVNQLQLDEDGFEIIPEHVRQQAERDENARANRRVQEQQTQQQQVNDNVQQQVQGGVLLNMEKFIVGLIASLWPEWQPHALQHRQ